MRIIRASASASGTRNVYDNSLDFSSFGGFPSASGADNISAVASFNAAYALLSGRTRLYIAPGTYTGNAAFNFANTSGVAGSSLVIEAYGVTLTAPGGAANGVAITSGLVQGADNFKETRIDTVNSGASTVTLKTAAETSRFSVGQWCIVSGVNLQGAGDPPNLGIFEHKKIQSIGTGTLTFTEPLVNSYKDTWPAYAGGGVGRGGPASVYPLQGFWDQEVEVKGARFTDTGNLTYGKPRVMQWTDCTFDTYGPCPTINKLFRMVRSTTQGNVIEVDKCVQRMEVIDSTPNAVDFQSSSVNELYVTGTTVASYWRGVAGGDTYINGLDVPEFRFGVSSYGTVRGHTELVDCNSANATFSTGYVFDLADYTEEGGGVISIAGGPVTWAVPGGYFYLASGTNPQNFAASYQVTDISTSGGRTYVTTTLPDPVPGTINGQNAPFKIRPHPGADVTCTNCTGSTLFTNQSLLPAHSPLFGWTL